MFYWLELFLINISFFYGWFSNIYRWSSSFLLLCLCFDCIWSLFNRLLKLILKLFNHFSLSFYNLFYWLWQLILLSLCFLFLLILFLLCFFNVRNYNPIIYAFKQRFLNICIHLCWYSCCICLYFLSLWLGLFLFLRGLLDCLLDLTFRKRLNFSERFLIGISILNHFNILLLRFFNFGGWIHNFLCFLLLFLSSLLFTSLYILQ